MKPSTVAASFSRAAPHYDHAAQLQRDVGNALVADLPTQTHGTVVDIGCGTGFVTEALLQRDSGEVIALDIAQGMLQCTRKRLPAAHVVQADMQSLPLGTACASLLVSNLALQWAEDLLQCFGECRRVLVAGGTFHFTTFLPGTLGELEACWQTVDAAVHVNRFVPENDIIAALSEAGFSNIRTRAARHVLHFAALEDLARELKAIGAHNMNAGRPAGLTSRRRWQQLQSAYEARRTGQGLPATYEVIHVTAA